MKRKSILILVATIVCINLSTFNLRCFFSFDNFVDSPTNSPIVLAAEKMPYSQTQELKLDRQSFNSLFGQLSQIKEMKAIKAKLIWQKDVIKLAGETTIKGKKVPFEVTSDLKVNQKKEFVFDIESVSLGILPLPKKQALEIMAKQIKLPKGLSLNTQKSQIIMDLNQIIPQKEGLFVQAKSANLKKNQVVVLLNYDPAKVNPLEFSLIP
ncbi:DUF2140 family protein [Vaginisenegalia massiliensis]|uniref:DUF2140 family protein n=1 Tax=Vaginisenegalia massiliensis TaxID=2058294 RepID=UPI000F54C5E2|nr:DUF2140 family protein [Vaginisenegalia massiliensis]